MAARHPLFVANGTAGVTTPQDARLALASLLSGPGILNGFSVSGSSSGPNMKYLVAAGAVVTQRGTLAADGLYLWTNDGTVTVDTGAPAPTSGTRYDVIYALARNANDGFGDANSDPVIGFVVGTASSTPTVPAAPAGALVLAQALVATNAANAAAGATITNVAAKATLAGQNDTGWTSMASLSYSAGSPAPQVRVEAGILYARGVVSRGGTVTAGDIPCTSPAGFRPAASHSWLAATTGSAMVRLTWDTTGAFNVANVITISGTPTTIFIDTAIPLN